MVAKFILSKAIDKSGIDGLSTIQKMKQFLLFTSVVPLVQEELGEQVPCVILFTVAGFKNWKAAKDRTKGFKQHSSSHIHIVEARNICTVFMGQVPDLRDMLIDWRKKQRVTCRRQ